MKYYISLVLYAILTLTVTIMPMPGKSRGGKRGRKPRAPHAQIQKPSRTSPVSQRSCVAPASNSSRAVPAPNHQQAPKSTRAIYNTSSRGGAARAVIIPSSPGAHPELVPLSPYPQASSPSGYFGLLADLPPISPRADSPAHICESPSTHPNADPLIHDGPPVSPRTYNVDQLTIQIPSPPPYTPPSPNSPYSLYAHPPFYLLSSPKNETGNTPTSSHSSDLSPFAEPFNYLTLTMLDSPKSVSSQPSEQARTTPPLPHAYTSYSPCTEFEERQKPDKVDEQRDEQLYDQSVLTESKLAAWQKQQQEMREISNHLERLNHFKPTAEERKRFCETLALFYRKNRIADPKE